MSKLNLKRLPPGDNVSFVVEGTVFEQVARSAAIDIKVPPAVPLMSKVTTTYTPPATIYTNVYNGGDEFGFISFKRIGTLGSGFYRLRLYFETKKPKNQLSNGDVVRIRATTSTLAPLNGVTATIYASNISNNKTGSYIDLRVSNTYQPTQTSGTANKTNDYLKESTGRKKQRRYTVQIPDAEVFQKLIDAKENTTGEPSWIVRDVPIYAYRNYDGKIKSSDKLLSMLNDSEISLKIPPEYSLNLRQNFLQKSFTRVFDIGDKPSYIFYVAIARYIKKGENWTGEWLQTGSSGNPFWSKAVKSGN